MSFEVGSVASVALPDADGKLIGVKFPSQQETADNWIRWAGADFRSSDRYYGIGIPPVTKVSEENQHRWELPEAEHAPWNTGGQPPTYVFVHGTADGKGAIRAEAGDGT
ncbi:hypothetical protein [Nocardia brasiliensis]|uniref:hypothetical protein n=1 Tax=Nocardia brasiliensis TaxID=37326 RepID=UPI0024550A23|nr:hypothetical protein [Nocardia brasiliensis]